MRTVAAGGEAGLLRPIFRAFGPGAPRAVNVVLGSGDDAAALRVPSGELLVVSQDDQVEGTHFERRWTDPRLLAERLLRINLSDLAAMGGARPLGCTCSVGLPPTLPRSWFDGLLAGLRAASRRLGLPVVGGNLSRSRRIFLSLAVFGSARRDSLVRRSGARPGDILAGVGPLGEAAAGLRLLKGRRPVPRWARPLLRRFWSPEPLFTPARALAGRASALMDNSDGLRRSIETLAAASGTGFELGSEGLPASGALRRWCRERRVPLLRHQWEGGEDYGLVFTVPPRAWKAVRRAVPGVYVLGRAAARRGPGRDPADSGPPGSSRQGFEHFR